MDFEDQVVEAVIDCAQLEYPPVLVEAEINRLVDERTKYGQRGAQSLEEYLRDVNKTEEELREELRPLAVKRGNWSLVLEKVAEEEKIEVDDSEVKAEIENLTKDAREGKDELEKLLNTSQSHESIKQRLIIRKTIQRLVEIAEGLENKEDIDVQ